ncbi:MAG: ATP synthase F1 subunit delta [bacterium]|nr:ATP synthase F1 subunit delta [bacterium]
MKGKDTAKILAKAVYTALFGKDKKQSDFVVANFLSYLRQHRLEKMIPKILKELENIYFSEHQIISASIYSKEKLDEKQVKNIVKRIEEKTNKKVISQEEIDESLIGGAVVKYGNMVIDLSIKSQLNKLAKQLSN